MYDDDELSKCWGVTYLCNDPFQNRIGEVVHPHTQEDPGHRLAPIVVTITQPLRLPSFANRRVHKPISNRIRAKGEATKECVRAAVTQQQ